MRFRESSPESEDDESSRCLAIASEDGSRLVVFDTLGKPRSFSQTGVDLRNLCFQTHGLLHVDDLLTPCFDEDGNYGDPEETCFCGLDTPHIHAHLKSPHTCQDESPCSRTSKKNNKFFSSEERMGMLATHILYPMEEGTTNDEKLLDIPVSKSMPVECNASHNETRVVPPKHHDHDRSQHHPKWSVLHGNNHMDRLVHSRRRNELRLQHNDCEDCGSSCIHGVFTFGGQRSWETPSGGSLTLHFFYTPQKAFDFHQQFGAAISTSKQTVIAEEDTEEITINDDNHEENKAEATNNSFSPTTPRCEAMCCKAFKFQQQFQAAISTSKQTVIAEEDTEEITTNDNHEENKAEATNNSFSRTTLRCEAMCCSSECPLIIKCLEEIPGIQTVEFDVPEKLVLVEHDANLITSETIESLLNEDDFEASIVVNDVKGGVITSKFRCNDICCSAECPLISMCLQDKEGVIGIDFIVPEKLVIVNHDSTLVTAQEIVEMLIADDFDASVLDEVVKEASPSTEEISQINKTADVQEPNEEPSAVEKFVTGTVRSAFLCGGICCSAESTQIKRIVEPLCGVTNVAINVTSKLVYVDHDASIVTAHDIARKLTSQGFPSEIRIDGIRSKQTESLKQSMFCSSTFRLECSRALEEDELVCYKEEIENLLEATFDKSQVDSCVFDLPSRSIHITHNAHAVAASEIQRKLSQRTSIPLELISDGKTALHIDYAALASQASDNQVESIESQEQSGRFPKPAVIISGILWIISMISLAGGKVENLKYVGLGSIVFGLPSIAIKAFKAMRRLSMDTNALMFFASVGALALGEITEAAAVVFLFALSEWLEFRATSRARQTLEAIVNLRPDKARLLNPETNELFEVAASAVPIGGLCAVKTGDKIPCDGKTSEGSSSFPATRPVKIREYHAYTFPFRRYHCRGSVYRGRI